MQYLDGALHKFGLESGAACCLHLTRCQRIWLQAAAPQPPARGLGERGSEGRGCPRAAHRCGSAPWDGFMRALSAAAGCSLVLLAGGCPRGSLCLKLINLLVPSRKTLGSLSGLCFPPTPHFASPGFQCKQFFFCLATVFPQTGGAPPASRLCQPGQMLTVTLGCLLCCCGGAVHAMGTIWGRTAGIGVCQVLP